MKKIWGWLSEVLFASAESAPAPARPQAHALVIDTPPSWSMRDVNELRWA